MSTEYTLDDVAKHSTPEDCWVVIHNKVYDIKPYLLDHPGGEDILLEVAGTDATAAFDDVGHSDSATEQMAPLLIGKLAGGGMPESLDDLKTNYKIDYVAVKSAPILRKKPSNSSKLPTYLLRTAAASGALYLAVRTYQDPRTLRNISARSLLTALKSTATSLTSTSTTPQTNSSFWRGFIAASAVSVSAFTCTAVWLRHALEVNKEFTIFPPRAKSTYRIYPKEKPVSRAVLHPQQFRKFVLVDKIKISPNVYRFIFALPHEDDVLGLPIGQHVSIRAGIDGQNVMRSYTPTSNDKDVGRIELVIKVYPNGLLTNYLASLNPGDEVEFRGPKGAMKYHNGLAKKIGMIAGGTGITPMYQLIRSICEDPNDHTQVSLLYANQTEEDILLREELERWAKENPEKFKVHYVLGNPPEGWTGSTGFVTKELIEEWFPKAEEEGAKAMLCGPPGMVAAMKNNLGGLGWEKPGAISKAGDQVFVF